LVKIADPVGRTGPHGAMLWRLRDDVAARWRWVAFSRLTLRKKELIIR
jgi:hypothetical protein